jgi:hypothetical protein
MENQKPLLETDTIALGIERLSSLSSEMISLLENFNREINRSTLELQEVQSAAEAGKRELEALCKTKSELSSLGQVLEDLRRQKESLECGIADQQSAWEEVKSTRAREEREYEANLKMLRQREEEDHRLTLENEQITARKRLEEELDAMQQESAEIKAAVEKDLLAREAALNKKERELTLLMQEVEKLLSGLAGRIGIEGQSGPHAPGSAKTGSGRGKLVFFGAHGETGGGFNPGNDLMW